MFGVFLISSMMYDYKAAFTRLTLYHMVLKVSPKVFFVKKNVLTAQQISTLWLLQKIS